VVLPEDVIKGFGAVFPCEDLVAHGGECRDDRRFVMEEFGEIFREEWRKRQVAKFAKVKKDIGLEVKMEYSTSFRDFFGNCRVGESGGMATVGGDEWFETWKFGNGDSSAGGVSGCGGRYSGPVLHIDSREGEEGAEGDHGPGAGGGAGG
jgi:hypothetical protein